MDQLRGAGMLYFKLELDRPTFGFHSAAWLWLSVPPSYLAETGAALAKFPEVAHAYATTGPANLAACAICRDEESLYRVPDGQDRRPARGRAAGDLADHPHGQAGLSHHRRRAGHHRDHGS